MKVQIKYTKTGSEQNFTPTWRDLAGGAQVV